MTTSDNDLYATLWRHEQWWSKHEPFLFERGYQLRPRYRRDWVPSWTLPGSGFDPLAENYADFEDSVASLRRNVLDATRISDNRKVVLRKVMCAGPERFILDYLHQPHLRADTNNRTVPVLDIIPLPDDDTTLLIGLDFLHTHNIAHQDACAGNMMMDATDVVPGGFHFCSPRTVNGDLRSDYEWRDRCSVPAVQYYFIDFGLSTYHPELEGQQLARSAGIVGQDDTVPELSMTVEYNPFKLDIYQSGNCFLNLSKRYPKMTPCFGSLLHNMTDENPHERPWASEVIKRFEEACKSISDTELGESLDFVPQDILDEILPFIGREITSEPELN
uniref:Protein kinase domain-containing protein n=1 Tax=Mycena chlorophos TaxID=658473 RepID=A0ABQ0LW64_MYCCL|nr:predicted protein [Mycena chlorophos]